MFTDRLQTIMGREFNHAARLREAAAEIEIACAALAEDAVREGQLADLADAIDAFKERDYGVAAALARAATCSRAAVRDYRRPNAASLSLKELCQRFQRVRQQVEV